MELKMKEYEERVKKNEKESILTEEPLIVDINKPDIELTSKPIKSRLKVALEQNSNDDNIPTIPTIKEMKNDAIQISKNDSAKKIKIFEEEDESGYGTDTGSVMTDYTTETYNDNTTEYSEGEGEESEWQEFWDEQAEGKYWYNNYTGEASWTKPGEVTDEYSSLGSIPNDPAPAIDGPTEDWVSSVDDITGQEYWYNVKTGESSWQ
jgi:hypothetical protein